MTLLCLHMLPLPVHEFNVLSLSLPVFVFFLGHLLSAFFLQRSRFLPTGACTLLSSGPAGSLFWTSGEWQFHQIHLYHFSKEHLVCLNIVLMIYSQFYWALQTGLLLVVSWRKTVFTKWWNLIWSACTSWTCFIISMSKSLRDPCWHIGGELEPVVLLCLHSRLRHGDIITCGQEIVQLITSCTV